ncbi:MAG: nuclear transport factor 2 family protein [Myxococcota bacterium]
MLSLQEISDRLEIQDLIHRYAQIIDAKDFDRLRVDVFCEDAWIDYSAFGGPKGGLEQAIEFLHKAMKIFPHTQHMNANAQIVVESELDRGTGRIMCFNSQELKLPERDEQIFFCGLWYLDEYRRTPEGWRIAKRAEEKSFVFNAPDSFNL